MTQAFEVTDSVPHPNGGTKGVRKYPFDRMEVGQSFYVFPEPGTTPSIAAYQYARRHGKKFSCRREGDGVRIWRIA